MPRIESITTKLKFPELTEATFTKLRDVISAYEKLHDLLSFVAEESANPPSDTEWSRIKGMLIEAAGHWNLLDYSLRTKTIDVANATERDAMFLSLKAKYKWFQYTPWTGDGDAGRFTVTDEPDVLTPAQAIKQYFATEEQIVRARKEYGTDEIGIDEMLVRTSVGNEGVWIAAWVWLAKDGDKDGDQQCDNCDALWNQESLKAVEDIFQRVAPGEPMPSGECPNCGALCHPKKEG